MTRTALDRLNRNGKSFLQKQMTTNAVLKTAMSPQEPLKVSNSGKVKALPVLYYPCPNTAVRHLIVSMLKEKKVPLVSPDDSRSDIIDQHSLFPYFWMSESEAGFAATDNNCVRIARGCLTKASNTDEILARIAEWQPNIRVSSVDADFIVYNNGNLRINSNIFVDGATFDELVKARKKVMRPTSYKKKSSPTTS